MAAIYTDEEFRNFRTLLDWAESSDQVTRIKGRFGMRKFVSEHGKEKCDAMFAADKALVEARRK